MYRFVEIQLNRALPQLFTLSLSLSLYTTHISSHLISSIPPHSHDAVQVFIRTSRHPPNQPPDLSLRQWIHTLPRAHLAQRQGSQQESLAASAGAMDPASRPWFAADGPQEGRRGHDVLAKPHLCARCVSGADRLGLHL